MVVTCSLLCRARAIRRRSGWAFERDTSESLRIVGAWKSQKFESLTETIGANSAENLIQTQIFSTMKNKKKQRERLGQTSFERPVEYSKPSKNGMEKMNGNGAPKSMEKSNGKR